MTDQYDQDILDRLSPAEINTARRAGRLTDLMAGSTTARQGTRHTL